MEKEKMQQSAEVSSSNSLEPVVYVVDDMEDVLQVVGMILEKEGINYKTFRSGSDFLAQEDISQVGCLLLDNQMPGMTGLDVQSELVKRGSSIPIIFVSGASRYVEVVDAVREGALNFLQKPFTRTELLTLVSDAIEESRKRLSSASNSAVNKALLSQLTKRELQVYTLVTDGLTNRAIAQELDISNGTVEFHRANMMKKLNAGSLADLMEIKRSQA